jgi:uncharacterized membrane protein YgcG
VTPTGQPAQPAYPSAPPPATGPPYPPSGDALRPSRGLAGKPAMLMVTVATFLVIAIGAGVAVPNLISHHPVSPFAAHGGGATTTAPASPVSTTAPASPVSTTAPASTTPAGRPSPSPTPTVAPGTTPVPTEGCPTCFARNSVVIVPLPTGWSIDPVSNATDLLLNGPANVTMEFYRSEEPAPYTLTEFFTARVSSLQQKFPDAALCGPAQPAKLPGNGPEGVEAPICFTVAPQNGPATQVVIYQFAGLVLVSGPAEQLYVVGTIAPRSLTTADVVKLALPIWERVGWLGLASVAPAGGGGGVAPVPAGSTGPPVGGAAPITNPFDPGSPCYRVYCKPGNSGNSGNSGSGNSGSGNSGSSGKGSSGNTGTPAPSNSGASTGAGNS